MRLWKRSCVINHLLPVMIVLVARFCDSQTATAPAHGKALVNGSICGNDPEYLRTWTGYNWGEKPPYFCDNNYSYSWVNDSSRCPGSFYIWCAPCPANHTSVAPQYLMAYGTNVAPGFNSWAGSPLNCTALSARPGQFKNYSRACVPLNYCVDPCNISSYCPGGDSPPVPCPANKTTASRNSFFGNVSDCV